MRLKNGEIYNIALNFTTIDKSEFYDIPTVINFYIHKNMDIITEAGNSIEETRMIICQKYGAPCQDGSFRILEEHKDQAQRELDNLARIEQDLNIHMINIKDFEGTHISNKFLEAIMFMITDEEME